MPRPITQQSGPNLISEMQGVAAYRRFDADLAVTSLAVAGFSGATFGSSPDSICFASAFVKYLRRLSIFPVPIRREYSTTVLGLRPVISETSSAVSFIYLMD